MRRHELSDREWEAIQDALPKPKGRGRPPEDNRRLLNAMFWIVRTGAPWRDLPERYGPWQTVYDRFNRWAKDGTFKRILHRLQGVSQAQGHIDWELFCIDSTMIRASRAAAGAGQKGVLANR